MRAGEGSPRPLDHVVLPCADLDAAAAHLDALGFLVGRVNRHPWGTINRIVQFADAFLELIAFAPDAPPLAPEDDAYPFAGFLAGQGRGVNPSAMLVLRSDDAQADARRFAACGLGTGRMLRFSRHGQAPDGGTRRVAFTLAFADAPGLPALGFFVCQQHFPENFWNPAMQRHPNGCTGIAGVHLDVLRPADHAEFLESFTGCHATHGLDGLAIALPGRTALLVARHRATSAGSLAKLCFRGGPSGRAASLGHIALRFGAA